MVDWKTIVFWVFLVFALIILAWLVFGHSPEAETLAAALLGSQAILWKMVYDQGKELAGIKNELIHTGKSVSRKRN
ncbi:MAG: hypothetical protein AB1467_02835 [Candidatus Diapherotrites archaeon]